MQEQVFHKSNNDINRFKLLIIHTYSEVQIKAESGFGFLTSLALPGQGQSFNLCRHLPGWTGSPFHLSLSHFLPILMVAVYLALNLYTCLIIAPHCITT